MLSAASTTIYSAILQKHFCPHLGLVLFTLTVAFNFWVFQDQSKVLYGFALLVLIVLVVGRPPGHRAWLRLAGSASRRRSSAA